MRLLDRPIVVGLGVVLTVALTTVTSLKLSAMPTCNGKIAGNQKHCGIEQLCNANATSDDCTRQKELEPKGRFDCVGGTSTDYCGELGDPVKCDCSWYCDFEPEIPPINPGGVSVPSLCLKGDKVLEPDPDNPGQMRQVCSYDIESADQSCNIAG